MLYERPRDGIIIYHQPCSSSVLLLWQLWYNILRATQYYTITTIVHTLTRPAFFVTLTSSCPFLTSFHFTTPYLTSFHFILLYSTSPYFTLPRTLCHTASHYNFILYTILYSVVFFIRLYFLFCSTILYTLFHLSHHLNLLYLNLFNFTSSFLHFTLPDLMFLYFILSFYLLQECPSICLSSSSGLNER